MSAKPRPTTLLVLVLAPLALLASLLAEPTKMPDFETACVDEDPFFVAASYRAQTGDQRPPGMTAPSVLLFQDTPQDRVHHTLATFRDTGAVWGLAYRAGEHAVYAATFHKRGLPYGPEGAGAIYRVDLETGETSHFVTVPDAGRQRGSRFSDGSREHDAAGARRVGKTALGGMDVSPDESELYVMNLDDRRIYRYAMPDGQLLGSFAHGAQGERWNREARPFAVIAHGEHVYHGVVNAGGTGPNLLAKVYRSKPDGSEMTEVTTVPLTYQREGVRIPGLGGGSTQWTRWTDRVELPGGDRPRGHRPQPMLTDLAFNEDGIMVVGFRDRHWDITNQWIEEIASTPTMEVHPQTTPTTEVKTVAEEGYGFGDLLKGEPEDGAYQVDPDPEHFADTNGMNHAESALGGLACVPRTNLIASTHFGIERSNRERIGGYEGVYWFDLETGNKASEEVVGRPGSFQDYDRLLSSGGVASAHTLFPVEYNFEFYRELGTLGDVETLCDPCRVPPPTVTPGGPTDTPTATPVLPTDTPTATPTDTPTATRTPTPEPEPIYLPVLLSEECDPKRVRADVVLVMDTSSSMIGPKIASAREAAIAFIEAMRLPNDQVGVVTFNSTATIVSGLTGDGDALRELILAIEPAPGTRIDAGLDAAIEVLAGPDRRPANVPIVILLSDGLQYDDPERPIEIARRLADEGVDLYAVGLGADVDPAYLSELVAGEDRVYLSPEPEQLAQIYRQIAALIPCPPSSFWGGR